jgi:hypothetical protein
VGLERGLLNLVSTTEELLERKSIGFGLENGGMHRADHASPLYPQKLALTSPTSGDRSVSIVRLQTQTTSLFTRLLSFAVDIREDSRLGTLHIG